MAKQQKVKKEEIQNLLQKIDDLNNRSEKVIQNTNRLFLL